VHGTLAGVEHRVLRQRSTRLAALPAAQEAALHRQWRRWLRDARPDAVLTFGGMLYSRAVLAQARSAGIRTAFYLAAPGYRDRAAFDDADRGVRGLSPRWPRRTVWRAIRACA